MSENKKNPKEVITHRLSTSNEKGERLYVYAAKIKGFYHSRKNKVHAFLILLFLILPWIKINGEQSLLLDIPNRRFNFFGLIMWAHDAPLIFFVLAIIVFSLAFVTAVWGRVWCGWACPQTVFIDGIFRRIDEWIEGSYIQRKKRDHGPWNAQKIRIKLTKYSVYLFLTLILTHSFLAYFVGIEELPKMVTSPPSENWFSFGFIVFTTSALLFNFLWFREQFCIIMCPYGRFQSILMDENSLAPLYDKERGEPRRQGKPQPDEKLGDCVNCFKCVNVCPTGIDIRNGIQMECVACTACIDACDEIMVKLKKPKGLIRYNSEIGEKKRKIIRPRVIVYFVSLLISIFGLIYFLNERKPYSISVLRQKGIPFKKIEGEKLNYSNFLKVYFKNQKQEDMKLSMSLKDQFKTENIQLVIPQNHQKVEKEGVFRTPIFIKFSKNYKFLKERHLVIDFKVEYQGKTYTEPKEFHLEY